MADESQRRSESKKTKAVIDRIEDNSRAVVQLGDDKSALVDLPLSLLPESATDGDHLVINVKLEQEAREAAVDRIRALQERLEKRTKS